MKYVRKGFKGHTGYGIWSLDFAPNGRLLVSTSYKDNTVRLWNMRYGAATIFADHNARSLSDDYYTSAVFSPDERYIAASHTDGMVRIWDVRTGQLMRRVNAHMGWVNCVAFMPDGKGFVSGGWDGMLKYWNISTLDPTPFRARSLTRNDSQGHVSEVDEQTQPEREFSGHTVRTLSYFSYHSPFYLLPFSRILSTPLPSTLTADGLLLARSIKLSVSGILAMQQCNVSSAIAKWYTLLISVQQGLF
jgi:WD40 repeat protein